MSYLLDTCVISKLRKLAKNPDKQLESWFEKHDMNSYFISVLTIGEIQAGISKLNSNQSQQKMILEDWLFGDLIPNFEGRIIPIDPQIALTWGKLAGENKQRGQIIPLADALIAATAIVQNFILVTQNVKDFAGSGAILFNPWDDTRNH